MTHVAPLKPGDKVYALFWSSSPFFYMEATLNYYSNINAVILIKGAGYDQEQPHRTNDIVPKTKENLAILKEMRKTSEANNRKLGNLRDKLRY